MKNRVGLLGGTFNPIHRGHIDLGLQVRDAFSLDKVIYILSARPPHKREMHIVPAPVRFLMLEKALAPHRGLEPCDIEMKRPDFSYTYQTMAQLKELYPNTEFYFLSGSEGFLKIRTWKNYKTLLRELSFIVVLREDSAAKEVEELLAGENITPQYNIKTLSKAPSVYIYSYSSEKLFISSTLVRQRVKQNRGIDNLVGKEVQKIMQEYNLYEH